MTPVQRAPSPVPSDPLIPVISEPTSPPVMQSPSKPATPKASVTITQSGTSSTPTLKIRLPRLSAVSATTHSNPTLPTLQSPQLAPSPAPDTSTSHDSRPRRSLRRQDSASVSVSGTSSYTAEVVEDVEPVKPSKQQTLFFRPVNNLCQEQKPARGSRRHVEST